MDIGLEVCIDSILSFAIIQSLNGKGSFFFFGGWGGGAAWAGSELEVTNTC